MPLRSLTMSIFRSARSAGFFIRLERKTEGGGDKAGQLARGHGDLVLSRHRSAPSPRLAHLKLDAARTEPALLSLGCKGRTPGREG